MITLRAISRIAAIPVSVALEERLRLLRARLIRDEQRVEDTRLGIRALEEALAQQRGVVARG
jgi:hypothetical protein